ncbi:hypothetical protein D3C76_1226130 [compost metagenome]
MGVDRQAGTGGQHRVQAERQARGIDHLLDLGRDRLGHAHAAEQRVAPHPDPAAFGVGVVGLDKTGGRAHRAVVPMAAFFIGSAAERCDAAGSDLAGLFEHGERGLFVDQFSQAGQLRPELGHFENFIENEAHVAQGRFIVSHDNLSLVGSERSRGTAAGMYRV